MAIIKEFYKTRSDEVNLYRFYSDEKRMLLQNETGVKYAEAIDVEGAPYTYSETEDFIESDEPEIDESIEPNMNEIEEKAKAYDILMGVAE